MTAVLLNVARPAADSDPVTTARAALAAGLDGVGLADSPRLFPDCLVETERVLASTEARLAGPCVLSLGLRHPATVAGALRTLASHHPGRLLAVVGRGESSVRNEGLAVPPLRAHEESLSALRALLEGTSPAPRLLAAASGPRTIRASARLLPGVLIDTGANPAVVRKAVDVARAERPDVEIWLFLRAVVTSTSQEAEAAAMPVLGSCAARLVAAPDWYDVPAAELDALRQVAAAHDYRRHGTAAARGRVEGLQEADALVRERFVVTGDAAQVSRHVEDLSSPGVDGVVLAGALSGVLERLGDLAPAVRAGLARSIPKETR